MLSRFQAIIRPGVGLGDITFGTAASAVISRLGLPSTDCVDEEGDRVLMFPALGIRYLAFDSEEAFRLTSYEVDMVSDAELWEKKVFRISLREMKKLAALRQVGFERTEIPADIADREVETLYRIRSQSMDFYYEKERLVAVAGGVLSDLQDNIRWP